MNSAMRTILRTATGGSPSLPTIRAIKEEYVAYLFEATQHDLRETARILNVSPRTVHNRISKTSSRNTSSRRV